MNKLPSNIASRLRAQPKEIWTGDELLQQNRPIIYAWFRDDRPLYVGLGKKGVRRILGSHSKLNRIRSDDRLIFWFFETEAEAIEMEKQLIFHLQPVFNQAHKKAIYRPPVLTLEQKRRQHEHLLDRVRELRNERIAETR